MLEMHTTETYLERFVIPSQATSGTATVAMVKLVVAKDAKKTALEAEAHNESNHRRCFRLAN